MRRASVLRAVVASLVVAGSLAFATAVLADDPVPVPAARPRPSETPAPTPTPVAAEPAASPTPIDLSGDVEVRARELATSGHRAEAISLLRARLEQRPTDSDARTLLGTVLSWEGDYAAARAELERVIAEHPGHGDATPALIRVELWSDEPLRAEEIARNALLRSPDDTTLLYLHAKAQHALLHDSDALADLERALRIDPKDQLAADLKESIEDGRRLWTARVYYTLDLFDKQNAPWNEFYLSLKRDTGYGPFIVKY